MATKRSRRSRLRGERTCGYGFKKKHRGKGSKGGKGMAGTGKRAGQKHTWVLKNFPEGYFGKKGFKTEKNTGLRFMAINLDDIQENFDELIKRGLGKKNGSEIELNLKGFKILSRGKLNEKFKIHASAFSEKAKEKIEESKGTFELIK